MSDAADREDVLRSSQVAGRVVRGGVQRVAAYGAGIALTAAASIVLLRHLGVEQFGQYVTVMSLIALVAGVTDAGLTAIGARELSLRERGESRRQLVQNMVAIRLVLTPAGVLLAALFALAVGYDDVIVWGTLLAGLGLVLINTQSSMMLPLAVELENGRIAVAELIKNGVITVVIAVLAVAGATLVPFFVSTIAAGIAVIALTPLIVGRGGLLRPRFDAREARMLVLEALPVALSLALAQVYFRILIVMISLILTAHDTGLFGTSYRILEMLLLVPTLAFSVALPVTSVASAEDEGRLQYVTQRMTEVGLITAVGIAVIVAIVAEPVIVLLGGEEYRSAAPVLQIQVFALIGFFLNQAWSTVLISIRRQRMIAIGNAIALAVLLALGGVLIPTAGIQGAAAAAVAADALLAGLLLLFLVRSRPAIAPRLSFAWKVAAAGVLAAAVSLVPSLSAWVEGTIAAVIYAAVIWAAGLVPPEIMDLVRRPRAQAAAP